MKPDRFEQVDHIFQGALQCDASEREAFLNRACGADAELRSRVDALISSDQEAGSFIERPAFEVVAAMMAAEHSKIEAGQVIGPYQVISRLGSGGMGDVYLAHDSRLGRKVALSSCRNTSQGMNRGCVDSSRKRARHQPSTIRTSSPYSRSET